MEGDLTEAHASLDKVKEEMSSLKSLLYAKFGKTINLEDEFAEEDA